MASGHLDEVLRQKFRRRATLSLARLSTMKAKCCESYVNEEADKASAFEILKKAMKRLR